MACFGGVTAAGWAHEKVIVGIGNIKNALRGTYHAVRPKDAQRSLAELENRLNRRFNLPESIPRLVHVALGTPTMPEQLLELHLA